MCRILTADLWPSPWKIHVKEIKFIRKLQGSSVFMFSKCELFSQVFLKDIGLRCRKFIKQNRSSTLSGCLWCIRFVRTFCLLRWLHFLSKIVFKDVYFANYSCLLFLLLIDVRVDYSHYMKISWYPRNIIMNVSWTELLFGLCHWLYAASYF